MRRRRRLLRRGVRRPSRRSLRPCLAAKAHGQHREQAEVAHWSFRGIAASARRRRRIARGRSRSTPEEEPLEGIGRCGPSSSGARHRDRDDTTTPVRVLCLNPAVDDLQPDCILGGVEVEPTHLRHTVDRRPEPTAIDAREQAPGRWSPDHRRLRSAVDSDPPPRRGIQPRLTRTIRPSSSSSGATNQSPARCRRCGCDQQSRLVEEPTGGGDCGLIEHVLTGTDQSEDLRPAAQATRGRADLLVGGLASIEPIQLPEPGRQHDDEHREREGSDASHLGVKNIRMRRVRGRDSVEADGDTRKLCNPLHADENSGHEGGAIDGVDGSSGSARWCRG